MPIPLFESKKQNLTKSRSILNLTSQEKDKCIVKKDDPITRERVLRQKRSEKYLNMLCRLDSGEHIENTTLINEIIEAIRNEFPEIVIPGDFIGIVQLCLLGEPYEVHTISFTESIIMHYKKNQALPNGMEIARDIAQNKKYRFIEVYSHCLRAVEHCGDVSVIEL